MSAPGELSCDAVRAQLLEWARGGGTPLPPLVGLHLPTCGVCRRVAAEVEAGLEGWRAAVARPMPPALGERVLGRLQPEIREAAARARAARRQRQMRAGAGAALALAASVLLFVWWRPGSPSGALLELAQTGRSFGEATVVGAGSGPRQMIAGKPLSLAVGDQIQTAEASRAEVKVGSERAMILSASSLRLESLAANDVMVHLARGSVVVEVEPGHAKKKRFRVRTADAEVQVEGTLFRVRIGANGTEVAVARGSVRVRSLGGQELRLRSGSQAEVVPGGLREIAGGAELESELAEAFADAPPAEPPASSSPSTSTQPQELVEEDASAEVPSRVPAADRDRARHAARLASRRCEEARLGLRSFRRQSAVIRAERTVEVADCFFATGDKVRSLQLYEEVARRYSATAAGGNAAYEIGRIASLLGNSGKAQRAFGRYLERFPKGPLASEAMFRICTLQRQQKRSEAALDCSRKFRTRFPGSNRIAEAHFLEATVLRERGDCVGAVEAYTRSLESPGPLAEEAREWRDWCSRPAP